MGCKGKRLDIKCKKIIVEFVEKAVAEAIEQRASSCRSIDAAGCGASAKHVDDAKAKMKVKPSKSKNNILSGVEGVFEEDRSC